MTSLEVGVSQMLTLWGKLDLRVKIALGRHGLALEALRRERIETLHRVRETFYELSYLASARRILGDIKQRIRLVMDGEIAASKTGKGSVSGVLKIGVEYSLVDEELLDLKQAVWEKTQSLHYLVGKEVDADTGETVSPLPDEPSGDEVKRLLKTRNPELTAAVIRVSIADDELKLKKRENIPDVELGVSYMYRRDATDMRRSDMISGMAVFSIPVWFPKRNIPMVKEMEIAKDSSRAMEKDKANELEARAEVLLGRLKQAKERLELYNKSILPQAELGLETALARYGTGSVEFMPLIDGVRMILRYRKEVLAAQKDYRITYSELQALMGTEVLR
jgi:outer membrane protein TolC